MPKKSQINEYSDNWEKILIPWVASLWYHRVPLTLPLYLPPWLIIDNSTSLHFTPTHPITPIKLGTQFSKTLSTYGRLLTNQQNSKEATIATC